MARARKMTERQVLAVFDAFRSTGLQWAPVTEWGLELPEIGADLRAAILQERHCLVQMSEAQDRVVAARARFAKAVARGGWSEEECFDLMVRAGIWPEGPKEARAARAKREAKRRVGG